MLCLETCRGKYNEDDYLREIKGGYIGIKESVSFSKVCFFFILCNGQSFFNNAYKTDHF